MAGKEKNLRRLVKRRILTFYKPINININNSKIKIRQDMKTMLKSKHIRSILYLIPILMIVSGQVQAEVSFPQQKGLINDFADVIDPVYKQQMDLLVNELLNKTEVPIVVVTMPEIDGADYNDYANRLYEAWGIGKRELDQGVLIFLTLKERKMRIETGYGLEGILPDGLAGEIKDRYMLPWLKKNQFGQGLLNGTIALAGIIARDAGVKLTGAVKVKQPQNRRGAASIIPLLIIIFFFLFVSRRRGNSAWLLLPLLLGSGGGSRYGGSFGGFGGGFGGFGGGMSGGGGAGGGF
jgi:uncharacterized protein